MPPIYIHSVKDFKTNLSSLSNLSIIYLSSTNLLTDIYLIVVKAQNIKFISLTIFKCIIVLIIFSLFCNRSLRTFQFAKLKFYTY